MLVNLTTTELVTLLKSANLTVDGSYELMNRGLLNEDGWGRKTWKGDRIKELRDEAIWQLYCDLVGRKK